VTAAARSALIVTIGDEIVSGDVENTNGSWLARRLAGLGIQVRMLVALRDEIPQIAAFLGQRCEVDYVFVTGGLGGTPDDLTREAVAAAFGVACVELPALAAELRARFAHTGLGGYAARWANLPQGAEPLENPLGGAPGFRLDNVYVLPGLPSEMEAMFDALAEGFRGEPIVAWRRSYRTGEGHIAHLLEDATRRYPGVSVGSYPRFHADGPEVEIVLKSLDTALLSEASSWLEGALDRALRPTRGPERR
jgi:molybdenum cofactor synthesis domain-containing protein